MAERQENMAELLRVRGTSAYALAELSGLSRQTIWSMVGGRGDVFTDTLQYLAVGLDVPIERVFMAFRRTRTNAKAGAPV